MQLDNIPMFSKAEPHFWNWHTNVSKGSIYLGQLYIDALNYLNEHYVAPTEGIPCTVWCWNPGDAEMDDDVKDLIWDEAFSRYNTGNPLYSPNGNDGKRHCTYEEGDSTLHTDGVTRIDKFMNPIGCDYSDDVRDLINEPMVPWDPRP